MALDPLAEIAFTAAVLEKMNVLNRVVHSQSVIVPGATGTLNCLASAFHLNHYNKFRRRKQVQLKETGLYPKIRSFCQTCHTCLLAESSSTTSHSARSNISERHEIPS